MPHAFVDVETSDHVPDGGLLLVGENLVLAHLDAENTVKPIVLAHLDAESTVKQMVLAMGPIKISVWGLALVSFPKQIYLKGF